MLLVLYFLPVALSSPIDFHNRFTARLSCEFVRCVAALPCEICGTVLLCNCPLIMVHYYLLLPRKSVGGGIMFSGCLSIEFVRLFDRPCYYDILRMAWATLMKLTGNICYWYLMTWLDSEGQRSRSQQAVGVVKASMLTLGCRSLSSGCNHL